MSKNLSFDINSLTTSDTTAVDLIHPGNGELLGATMEVYGEDSAHYQDLARKTAAKYTAYAQKHHFRKSMPAEQAEEIELDKDVASVKSFTGFKDGTADLPFTAANVKLLFQRFPSFREQVRQSRADRALFIKG